MGEIQTPSGSTAGTLVLYLETIQDDTTGNNPHIGNGTYDDGMAYISGMSEIFAYSLINKNFIGIDDNTCAKISGFTFNVEKQEDNRKCWFFTDNYNTKYGKNVCVTKPGDTACCDSDSDEQEQIIFKEVDITSGVCKLHNCNDSRANKNGGCTSGLSFDIAALLKDENNINEIGKDADDYFQSGTVKEYGRTSALNAFDPETKQSSTSGEAAANSIVNVKNLDITFSIPSAFAGNTEIAFKRYVETSVIPYLTQMIPSTSILSWSFSGESPIDPPPVPPSPTPDPHETTHSLELTGTTC